MNHPNNTLVQKFFTRSTFALGADGQHDARPLGVVIAKIGKDKVVRVAFALRNVVTDRFNMKYLTDFALSRISTMEIVPASLTPALTPVNVPAKYWYGSVNDTKPHTNMLRLSEESVMTRNGGFLNKELKTLIRRHFKDAVRVEYFPQVCILKYPLKRYGQVIAPNLAISDPA